MFVLILLISMLIAFLSTYFIIPCFKQFFINIDVVSIDVQKKSKPTLPEATGFSVFFGFLTGMIVFVLLSSFYFKLDLVSLFAGLLAILLAMLIGFFDDIHISKKPFKNKYGVKLTRLGLPQWLKPILTILAAGPLMAIMAGSHSLTIPFIGVVNFGLLYPLFLVPMAFIVVTNSTNMLAGLNGLEGGLMLIVTIALGIFCLLNNRFEAAIISLIAFGAVIAYLIYNWYPASVFPGDSFTYFFGAVFATVTIIGNIEAFATFIFIPWVVEIILKLRSRLSAKSFGDLQKDGTLKAPYKKIYSWPHIFMKLPTVFNKRFKEYQVTLCILSVEVLFCIIGFIIFL